MTNRLFYLAPLLSGILLVLAFPPFRLFIPSFLALVPLLYFLDREESSLRAAAGSLFCGLVFWGALLYWITLFTRAGFLVLILVMSLNQVFFALLVRRFKTRFGVPVALSAPFVWTAIDYLHAHGDLAFTWGQLAYSLTHYPLWLQAASVSGPYGIILWLVSVNSLAYVLLRRLVLRSRLAYPSVALAVLLAGPLLWGAFRYRLDRRPEEKASEIRVSYIQPSIPQPEKWLPGMRDSTFKLLGSLSLSESARRPELVVWPEAAAPSYLRTDRYHQAMVGEVARSLGAFLLTGAPDYSYLPGGGSYDSYNSAFLFNAEGKIIESYNKIQMVPVSERMPWEDVFPRLREIDVGGSHFTPGDRHVVFTAGKERFGVLICFESTFPELSRRLVLDGARFLLNITNDAWFERTGAVYQHSSFLVLRAIENRREVVRSANTGISAYYDRLGRRRHASMLDQVAAATDTVKTGSRLTFYTRHGDWPAHLCWTLIVFMLLLSWLPAKSASAGDTSPRSGNP
ncbi:MAG: apolipoprotein N-acyltransferase [Candidatus Glassbacteria bacterium]|nr:apolipoprotein N-acyltransferase [Candidatus Glassbacteria bacterium]